MKARDGKLCILNYLFMPNIQRLNQYRIMWIMVLFDLPTNTKKERRIATQFRNHLLKDGFTMFQFSIYMRHSASRENAQVHEKRIKKLVPRLGKVAFLTVTDRQFATMEIFHGRKVVSNPEGPVQLELF